MPCRRSWVRIPSSALLYLLSLVPLHLRAHPIAGLEKAVELGIEELEVVSDSELLVKQMQGEYKVKNEALRELNDEANFLERKLGRVRYKAVRREHNELADKLVNEALDRE